jgi:hypothetical protein
MKQLKLPRNPSACFEAGMGTPSQPRLSLWGALLLKRSVIAVHQKDIATTWECLGEARAAARRLGADGNHFWTAFGPTDVILHEISAAVESGEWSDALRRAQTVDGLNFL